VLGFARVPTAAFVDHGRRPTLVAGRHSAYYMWYNTIVAREQIRLL
jgi:hypothetical protein